MSFRPSIRNICRKAFVGCICLASAVVSRGGEPIEIVPSRGDTTGTNIEQSQPSGTKNFESLGPHAPHTFHLPTASPAFTPPPQQQPVNQPTEREKELLDRRKNWVFMSPDDMLGQAESDLSGGVLESDKDTSGKKATTVMERYYERLYDSSRIAATNGATRLDSDSWAKATNSVAADSAHPGDGWFNSIADPGIFQPSRVNGSGFANVFSSSGGTPDPSPEAIRLQQEQKDHLESFKQLWDIDQPASPSTASTVVHAPSSPTPVFGSPAENQPTINAFNSSLGGLSGQAPAAPVTPTITSSRSIQPPRSDFAPPQRAF